MKPKTKEFVDLTLKNPKMSQTEAYIRTHETENRRAARVSASKLMNKPNVQIYKQAHVKKAKEKIVKLMESKDEAMVFKASESILDRELGKPLTRTNNVNMNINVETALNSLE